MKQKLFSLILLFTVCSMHTTVFAQGSRKAAQRISYEQIMQRKARYVSNHIGLDDSNKERFISLYNSYQKELKECQKLRHNKLTDKNAKGKKELTDAEITQRIENRFAVSHKILDIREKYYNEFKKFMTPRQIQKMYKAEKDIKKKIRNEVKRRTSTKNNKK